MTAPSHLKSLQALEVAVQTGSFAAAAEVLAITPAAVGQRVKALEDYLGVALLERGRAGISATPALLAALPDLHAGFAAIAAAAGVLDMQRGQELHIAAEPDFAELWLKPRLPAFRAAHPNARLCINGAGDVPMRLARVDCEISFGPPGDSSQRDTLFHDHVMPLASPGICDHISRLNPVSALEGFPLLHVDFYKDDPAGLSWPNWVAGHGIARTAPERGMRFQRISGALASMEADAGIALCGVALIGEAIEHGRVMLPFPATSGKATDHAFVARYRADSAQNRMVERFRAWLIMEARKTAEWTAAFAA